MNSLSFIEEAEEEDDYQDRVGRVQLGVFQTASLPVGLGNKLNSPCVTRLRLCFCLSMGKYHGKQHNQSSSIPPLGATEAMLVYTAVFVCV